MEKREGTIHQIPNLDAFEVKENSSVWAYIFTSYGVPLEKFQEVYHQVVTSGHQTLNIPRSIWMAFSDFENFKIPNIHMEALPGHKGEMVIYPHSYDTILPKSNFVYLATPYKDGNRVFNDAETLLEKLRALFCLLFGRNFLYQKILSAEIFNHPSTNINQVSQDLRFCSIAEGPFIHVNNTHEVEEIAVALGSLCGEERLRIDNAIHYFARGIEDEDTFLFFWTSIEMLCGNKKNRSKFTRETLKEIYPNLNINAVFGFTKLENIRDNWLHKGIVPNLNHDTFRYMQLMFLDILRYKLRLPTKKHLLAICESKDFNLSDVGLPSNGIERTRPIIRQASLEEMSIRSTRWCKVVDS